MQDALKNHLIDIEIFDYNKNQVGNIKKDGKKKDKENINIFIMDSYFYAIAIICIY